MGRHSAAGAGSINLEKAFSSLVKEKLPISWVILSALSS